VSYEGAITRADVSATMPVWVAPVGGGVAHLDPSCSHLNAGTPRARRPAAQHVATVSGQGLPWVSIGGKRTLRLCAYCGNP
jgi:hypothetical protein